MRANVTMTAGNCVGSAPRQWCLMYLQCIVPAVLCVVLFGLDSVADTNWQSVVEWPVKDATTHEMLRAAFTEKDRIVRAELVEAFGAIGDRADADRIRAGMKDPDASVRAAAVRAAGAMKLSLTDKETEALLSDSSAPVRRALMEQATIICGDSAGRVLSKGLSDPAADVRYFAGQSSVTRQEWAAALRGLWERERDGVVAGVMYAGALRWAGDGEREELMRRGLKSAQLPVVLAALRNASVSIPNIVDLLGHEQVIVRIEVVRCLRRTGYKAAAPRLMEMVTAKDSGLREVICGALGELAGEEAVRALGVRAREDEAFLVQVAAAGALARIHTSRALETLVELTGLSRASSREAAARALGGWGDPSVGESLMSLLHDAEARVMAAAADSLGRLRASRSVSALMARAGSGPAEVQERVAWALGEIGSKESVPVLMGMLSNGDQRVESRAVESLGKIGDTTVIPALRKVLVQMGAHDYTVRAEALKVLTQMRDKESVKRAIQLATERVVPPPPGTTEKLYDQDEVRIEALKLVGALGDKSSGEAILRGLTEAPTVAVRFHVASAVSQLTGERYVPVPDERYRSSAIESYDYWKRRTDLPPTGVVLKSNEANASIP
jgi:HEAT repeat protein